MNKNCPVIKWLAESNPHVLGEHKEVRNGVLGEDQRLLEEDELQINEDVEDIDDGQMEGVQDNAQPKAVLQRLQQQPQGPLVRWERFLPVRSLEVLLVENDDSTRHVVSALLRNCGYEVTAVENGLQAWKILEDLTTHIDLVLSEVAMPWLSGIDLLSKIMSHKSLQNIPVIMMSSYDSMNIVFKCLSKGASDFLAKPIRKNELKNLWQHVWRKCHSSSDSRSESDAHTKKSTKLKCGEASDNTGSNHEDDIGSIGLNVMDGNDNGSGTQSSWTKRAIEVDSPKPMSLCEQLADHPDGTCAQVIHSRTEAFGNNWVPMITATECEGQDNELDLEIGVSRIPLQLEDLGAKGLLTNIAITDGQKISEMKSKKDDEKLQNGQVELNSVKPNGDLRNKVADLMGLTTNSTDPQIESVVCDIPNGISKVSDMKVKALFDNKETPYLELSLKRLRDVGDTGTSAHDRNILRHSELSAFSRYNSASITNQTPIRNDGSCSPLDNSTEAAKTESVQNSQSDSNGTRSNQASNGSSDNNDMGSTTNNVFAKQVAFSDMPVPKSTVKSLHPSSAFQPVQSGHISPPQPIIQGKTDAAIASMDLSQERHINQQVQVQHHHHYYHHHHHHVHDNMPQKQLANHDDLSLKQITTAAPHCGSSNLLSEPFEGNVGNHSLNGSAAGSNHGSNGQSGSTTDINAGGTNMESDNGVAGKGGASGVIGLASRSADDPNRSAQREAALNKFRQKRKERCFEKKVRYQSRKELAEQRPRVRGQFVRQAVHKNKSKDMNCKPDLPLIVHIQSSR